MILGGSTYASAPIGATGIPDDGSRTLQVAATAPAPIGGLALYHRAYDLQIASVAPSPAGGLRLFHDWTSGLIPSEIQTVYTLTLTGTPDVLLPMSSFQATLTENRPSYLSCQVPNASAYAADIAARASGTLQVRKGVRFPDGTIQAEIIAAVQLSELRIDEGIPAATASLIGYQTVTPGVAKTRTLTGTQYLNTSQGKRRVRCSVDLFLQPGDTAVDGATSFPVGAISYYVGPDQQFMEVQARG